MGTKKLKKMLQTISNKQLDVILSQQIITNYTGYSSFSTDTKDLNFSASLDFSKDSFSCSMWLGDSEEEVELTQEQEDSIYDTIKWYSDADTEENEIDKEHSLTLIYS